MKKRIVRLNENDIENLVTKIIREEENSEWAICTKSVGYKNKEGKYKIHPDKQDEFERCKSKVKKQFDENLNEAGGYDTPELGHYHSENTMATLYQRFQEISDAVMHIHKMEYDITNDELAREARKFTDDMRPILNRFGAAWSRTEKRRLGRD